MLIIPKSRNINKSTVCSGFLNNDECDWLLKQDNRALNPYLTKKLSDIVDYVNGSLYKFVLNFIEGFETIYYSEKSEFNSSWHIDQVEMEAGGLLKLSLIIFLSSENSYTGGKLVFDPKSEDFQQELGTLVIFPAFFNYKFEPVTSGRLNIIKAWAFGPSFR
jgi:predicted 2-oxoglutarate/Fe(II)-dependent dioxygenase YbiX